MTPTENRLKELEPIAIRHGLDMKQVFAKSRDRRLVNARRDMAKYLAENGMKVTKIARIFKKDHSTIHHLLNTENGSLSQIRRRRKLKSL